MRKKFIILLIIDIVAKLNVASCQQITGYWVAQKIDQRYKGETAEIKGIIILVDKNNKKEKRNFILCRKKFEKINKLFFRFTSPEDIKDTSFLVYEKEFAENERFLYLPALGRVKRIASCEKEENFMGTDFSYEDISERKLKDYTYDLIEETATYLERPCYLLVSYPKEKIKFSKMLLWVDKESFCVLKVHYFDKEGKLIKIYEVKELKKIENIWTVTKCSMEDIERNHKTFLILQQVKYNIEIPSWRFLPEALKR